MRDLHHWVGYALIGANAFVGVWCAVAYQWPQLRSKAVWAGVIVAQLLVFVQALVGTILSQQAEANLNDMHALYGFSTIIAVAIMYSYHNSGFMKGKELLLYSGGSLFVMGLGLRNLTF